MNYHYRMPVDAHGRYRLWLRALRSRSGFFLIRLMPAKHRACVRRGRCGCDVSAAPLVAGGLSRSAKLYKAITAHFQKRSGRVLVPRRVMVAVALPTVH